MGVLRVSGKARSVPARALTGLAAAGAVWACICSPAAAGPDAQETAARIDDLLRKELFETSTVPAPLSDDETFLRRVTLDLTGTIPTPEEIQTFLADPSPEKRNAKVRELLDRSAFGESWARYFRDVILYRRAEDRAVLVSEPLVEHLSDALNSGTGWDKVAREFITATGDVRENGATAIIMAQDGRTEETVAEISRIFLGVQIQCAQCHDHPYDRWSREQFHELAAFFPRVGVRAVREGDQRSFAVIAVDRKRPRKRRPNNDRVPTAEHHMPDLDDPAADGTLMTPSFFLTDAALPLGTRDADRRAALAEWITNNEWFAKALVNRVWAELVGEGFYEPVDDIGPDRAATAPKTLDFLAGAFGRSGYDVKWLFRTICASQAYQRESRPRRDSQRPAFVANVPQPLRGDQLFSAVLAALGVDEDDLLGRRARQQRGNARRYATGPRGTFNATFGYDPSDAREEVSSTIPQVLAMMNSPQFAGRVRARGPRSALALLIEEHRGDGEEIVRRLYLQSLSREPTEKEQATIAKYVREVGNRREAYEDVLWALINSAEFRYRR
jgi:hypothetical protein